MAAFLSDAERVNRQRKYRFRLSLVRGTIPSAATPPATTACDMSAKFDRFRVITIRTRIRTRGAA